MNIYFAVLIAAVTVFAVYRRRSVKLAMKFLGFSMELEARDKDA